MSTEDQEAQEDELLALASIYSEDEFKRADAAPGGEIHLCLELPSGFIISIKSNSATNSFADNFENTVSFLPPIVFKFELPPGYPSTTPPNFTLSCVWLSPKQLSLLCQHLDDLWEENRGCVVLFSWIQFLKEETLDFLNITSPYEIDVPSNGLQSSMQSPEKNPADGERETLDKRAVQDEQSVSALVKYILDFNDTQKKKTFDNKPFSCNICFMEKLGSGCTLFKDCGHVYCNNCLKDYFNIQIKEGQVNALNCPEPECKSVATPAQVKDLVGEQLFSRYDHLLFQLSLDLMADVVYCPRPGCQTPVVQEPEGAMGICSACQYAFCVHCKMTFHGISPCKVPEQMEGLIEEGLNGKIGRRTLEKAAEQLKNREWIMENSKLCPGCKSPIEKDGGCNKMSCSKCGQYFCWFCLKILPQYNPYEHFSDYDGCSDLNVSMSNPMSPEDKKAQKDELLALTKIYSVEEFKRADAAPGGEIHLFLDLPSDFIISIKSNRARNNFEKTVSFLPPIVLNFELPPGYPSTTPPNFTLSCMWLSLAQLSLLCQHLDDLWEENRGYVVLFPWVQFLKEETLDFLNIKSPYEIDLSNNGFQNPADGERGLLDKRAKQEVQSVPALVRNILDCIEMQEKKVFDSKQFVCNICFMEKLGSECTLFKNCQHVYCNICLKDYLEIHIKEGQVHVMNCPEPECTSVATPAQAH